MTDRGQVTIPKQLRDRLGIRAGETLEFSEQGEGLLTARKASSQSALDAAYGALHLDRSSDELIGELRGESEAT